MHFVYIIKSTVRERFYIGVSRDPAKRLNQHNSGFTKSTKPYRPWKLIYKEVYTSKQEACKREWHLKHPSGYLEKKAIIEQYNQEQGGFA
ncbi:MAG: GIY-YIG nuclease family protein [Minisyncoccota bacterium]